jgi:hypothetical protein
MKFLRSVAGYIMKDQLRNTKIREELNIVNINNTILKSKITKEISCATNGRQANSEENSNIQPNKTTKYGAPTVEMEGPAYTLQQDGTGHAWPNP